MIFPCALRLAVPSVQDSYDVAGAIEDGTPGRARRAVAVHLHDVRQHLAHRAYRQGRVGHYRALAAALHRQVFSERVADDRDGVSPLQALGLVDEPEHPRRAAAYVHPQEPDVSRIGDAEEAGLEPLLRARELDGHRQGPAVPRFAHEDMLVGDQRALRVDCERGAREHLDVRILDDEERDRVLVVPRDRAVVDRRRARQAPLAGFGRIELRPQPGDRRRAAAGARRRKLAPQPGNLGLRFAERVPDAFELGLEPREQAPGFAIQAVGPCAQRDEVPSVARGLPLAPSESRQRQAEQADQYLGPAAQMRELRHDAQGGAGAALPRPGHRVRLACCHHHAEFHGGPLRPEADHVAIAEDDVARDPLSVDEGAVFRAQVADAERLAVPHDGRVARGDVEIALGVEANIR